MLRFYSTSLAWGRRLLIALAVFVIATSFDKAAADEFGIITINSAVEQTLNPQQASCEAGI